MQLHELKPKTPRKMRKVVGRGGKRGKTAGRGTKGQKARAGHRIRPMIRDMIKKLPKRRGEGTSRNRFKTPALNFVVLNIHVLNDVFMEGGPVTPKILLEKGLIEKKGSQMPTVKILGTGTLDKKLNVLGCLYSTGAKTAIEKAGGTIK
ncbi:MAG: 50S ribosomal protein L15 [Patescibacteria group bacterium]